MKKICFYILLSTLLIFAGCKKQGDSEQDKEDINYIELSTVYKVPAEAYPFELIGAGDKYFYYMHIKGDDEDSSKIYMQKMEEGSIGTDTKMANESLIGWCKSLYTDEAGEDFCVFLNSDTYNPCEDMYISLLNPSKEICTITLKDKDIFTEHPVAVNALDGDKYIVLTEEKFRIVNGEGDNVFCKSSENGSFANLDFVGDEYVGISLRNEKEIKTEVYSINSEKKVASLFSMQGNITVYSEIDDSLFYLSADRMNKYIVSEDRSKALFDFINSNIKVSDVSFICEKDGGFTAWGKGSNKLYVKAVDFSIKPDGERTENEGDKSGKKVIYVMNNAGESASFLLNDTIDAFNEQSNEYKAVLTDYNYLDDNNTAKYLSQNQIPDIMLSKNDMTVNSLIVKGYIEDLLPLFEKSDVFSIADFSKKIVNEYSMDGHLYSLPKQVTMKLTDIYIEDYESAGCFSEKKFEDFVNKYAGKAVSLLCKKDVFDSSIDSLIYELTDIENKKADFCISEFTDYLDFIKGLDIPDSFSSNKEKYDAILKADADTYVGVTSDKNFGAVCANEIRTKKECAVVGLPTFSGEPFAILDGEALSIFEASENKDGAFEFLTFYVTYMQDELSELVNYGDTSIYSYNEYNRIVVENMYNAVWDEREHDGEGYVYHFSKEKIDEAVNLYEYSHRMPYVCMKIRDVVEEEFMSFLEDGKTSEEICGIINSRVNIILNE